MKGEKDAFRQTDGAANDPTGARAKETGIEGAYTPEELQKRFPNNCTYAHLGLIED